jgi:hypothetical protein
MRAPLIRRCILLPRVIQLAAGILTALVSLAIFSYVLARVAAASGKGVPFDRFLLLLLLTLVVPGILVSGGSYMQTRLHKPWASAFVLLGFGSNAIFVGLYCGFFFVFYGDKWGQWAVLVDLIAVSLTVTAALANLILWFALPQHRLQPTVLSRVGC